MSRPLAIALSLLVLGAAAAAAHPTPSRPLAPRVRARPPAKKPAAEEGRPWLGVEMRQGKRGVGLNRVIDGTPARQAGLVAGDEILAVDGRAVTTMQDLQARIGGLRVGQKVTLDVLRRTRRFSVTVKLALKLDDQEELERLRLDRPTPAIEVLPVHRDSGEKTRALTMASLRGKVIIVEFLATWCGPCKSTYETLGDLQARRRADGLIVLGVSDESDAALRALISQEQLGFTLARDVGAVVYHAFHEGLPSRVTPTLFVIDRKGVVRFAGLGAGPTLDHAIFAAERALADGAAD